MWTCTRVCIHAYSMQGQVFHLELDTEWLLLRSLQTKSVTHTPRELHTGCFMQQERHTFGVMVFEPNCN